MAKRSFADNIEYITLSPQEAANTIALLAGQLSDTSVLDQQVGKAATLIVRDENECGSYLALIVKND